MKFSEWLKLREVGTGAGMIAPFARPIGAVVTRMYPAPVTMDVDSFFHKKKKNKKKKRKH
jgi:hypothetical protein